MDRQPLVSIIIPTYNTGIYLQRCIESVLQQTYKNIEILICDDYSDDLQTILIIQDFINKFPIKIRKLSHSNKGANFAREIGIKKSAGDFLIFLDSDDELIQGSISLMVKKIISDKSEIVIAKLLRVDAEKNIIDKNISTFPNQSLVNLDHTNILEYEFFIKPTLCGKLYKKELFNNIPFENPPFYQDWNVTYKLLLKVKRVSFLNEFVYFYRFLKKSSASPATLSNQFSINDAWISIEGILKYFYDGPPKSDYLPFIKSISFNFLTSIIIRSFYIKSRKKRKEIHKKCKMFWFNNFAHSNFKLEKGKILKLMLNHFYLAEFIRIGFTLRKVVYQRYKM